MGPPLARVERSDDSPYYGRGSGRYQPMEHTPSFRLFGSRLGVGTVALACTLVIAQPSAMQNQLQEQASVLKGLTRVRVIADALPAAVVQLGVADSWIVSDAEGALRRSGLVLDKSADAQLRVTINAVDIR